MVAIGVIETTHRGRTGSVSAGRPPSVGLLSAGEAAGLADEWRALAAAAIEPNHFFLPDVVLAGMRSFAPSLRVLALRGAGGRLIAVAPVTPSRFGRIATALHVWSHEYGPFGAPLVAGGALAEAAPLLIGAAPTLVFPDLPLDRPLACALLQAAKEAGRAVHVLDTHRRAALFRDTVAADLRTTLPTRRRKEYARQMRRLADLGSVAIEAASTPQAVAPAFEEFLSLEAAGWKGRGETAVLSDPGIADFARAVVAGRAAAGGVRVAALRLAGRPIAMVVTFLSGASAWTWKIAHDEAYARFSPGAQLMLELPRLIFADKTIERIDSLATADHPMIDHLWPGRVTIGTVVIGSGGLVHRLALLSAEIEIRARTVARRFRDHVRRGHRTGEEGGIERGPKRQGGEPDRGE